MHPAVQFQEHSKSESTKALLGFLAALCVSMSATAAGPSVESIDRLLEVTEVQKMLGGMQQQCDGLIKASISEVLRGEVLTAEAQGAVDAYRAKAAAIMGESAVQASLTSATGLLPKSARPR